MAARTSASHTKPATVTCGAGGAGAAEGIEQEADGGGAAPGRFAARNRSTTLAAALTGDAVLTSTPRVARYFSTALTSVWRSTVVLPATVEVCAVEAVTSNASSGFR